MSSTLPPKLAQQAQKFLTSNGLVWQPTEITINVKASDGTVRQEKQTTHQLGIQTEYGFDPLTGIVTGNKPDGRTAYATLPLQFQGAGAVAAAQELLLGDFEAIFTLSGTPIFLAWDINFQMALLDVPIEKLDSQKLREILTDAIAQCAI